MKGETASLDARVAALELAVLRLVAADAPVPDGLEQLERHLERRQAETSLSTRPLLGQTVVFRLDVGGCFVGRVIGDDDLHVTIDAGKRYGHLSALRSRAILCPEDWLDSEDFDR